ncbi:hypothetical protein QJQ45_012695 [Haematococcus lacustris]|nr:hypothetical protein QJQ45_012695 [Haematococcus lacustris]
MKILVAIKRVVDYAVPVRVRPDQSAVEAVLPKYSMNPFCEIALEDTLRSALALGADRALHVSCDTELQPLAVARLLAALARKEQPGLLLLGKQAIDDDCNQTGQMTAALLGWPQATFASKVLMEPTSQQAAAGAGAAEGGGGGVPCSHVLVSREVEGGVETLRLLLPAVVTADLRLNTPRFVTLPNTLKAKRKQIEGTTPGELGVDVTPQLTTLRYEPPAKRKGGTLVGSVAELVQKLRDEAKANMALAPGDLQSHASTSISPPQHIVICGGGVIGAACAFYLAEMGLASRVTLVEREGVACAASGKAGGFLALDWNDSGSSRELSRTSYALHAELADIFGAERIGYRAVNTLSVAAVERGLGSGMASPPGRKLLPHWVDGPVVAAAGMGSKKTTAQVHPALLTHALVDSAVERGAKLMTATVTGLQLGPTDNAVTGPLFELDQKYLLAYTSSH